MKLINSNPTTGISTHSQVEASNPAAISEAQTAIAGTARDGGEMPKNVKTVRQLIEGRLGEATGDLEKAEKRKKFFDTLIIVCFIAAFLTLPEGFLLVHTIQKVFLLGILLASLAIPFYTASYAHKKANQTYENIKVLKTKIEFLENLQKDAIFKSIEDRKVSEKNEETVIEIMKNHRLHKKEILDKMFAKLNARTDPSDRYRNIYIRLNYIWNELFYEKANYTHKFLQDKKALDALLD